MKNFYQTPKQKRLALSSQKAKFNAPKKTFTKQPLSWYDRYYYPRGFSYFSFNQYLVP